MSGIERTGDGLSEFSLEQIGRKAGAFGGASRLKFNDGRFLTPAGLVIGPEPEFLVLGLKKIVCKFVQNKLVDRIIVPDGEYVPDIEAMNEKAPKTEWGTDLNGEPAGPYKLRLLLKLIDLKTFNLFAFITDTVGGGIAIGELSDKTKMMRRIHGPNISPVISLGVTFFKAGKWGMKRRPDFQALRWIELRSNELPGDPHSPQPALDRPNGNKPNGDAATPAVDTSDAPTQPVPAMTQIARAEKGTVTTMTGLGTEKAAITTLGKEVAAPSLRDEMGDEVPF